MKKSKSELDEKRAKYLSLKQVTQSKGWELVEKILRDEFNDALDSVCNPKSIKAEVEARGIIKFIKKFTETLNSEMAFGKMAQEEYIKYYINPPKDSESVLGEKEKRWQ